MIVVRLPCASCSRPVLLWCIFCELTNKRLQVLVPIANDTEEMEAVIVADVLRRAGADVTIASVESELQILASRKVNLVADTHIASCESHQYDLIVLPVRVSSL